MTPWKWAMLAIVPFMAPHQKLRTWSAVMASSVLAFLFPLSPQHYIAIDLICGFVVLTRPAGVAQRAIGLLFAGMLIVDVGYWLSPQWDGGQLYYLVLSCLGWLQWAILAAWGLHDLGQTAFCRHWLVGRAVARRDGPR